MKRSLILFLAVACLGLILSNGRFDSSAAVQQKESKTQPKDTVLDKDSQSDKYGEVPFNHENHATKNYNPAGTAPLTCVECHHTDQPASELKAPLKTSERTAILTTASLQAADAK